MGISHLQLQPVATQLCAYHQLNQPLYEAFPSSHEGFDVLLSVDALDEASRSRQPSQSVLAFLEELKRRRGPAISLWNRDEESLETIVSFTVRYILQDAVSSILIEVAHTLCNIYADALPASRKSLFGKLKNSVHEEIRWFKKSLLRISGMLGTLITIQQEDAESILVTTILTTFKRLH
jgi:hypothetical protein